jgi:hypothetical protein
VVDPVTVEISASIMAHPDRLDSVKTLLDVLGEDVPVSWDDEGPASGNADRVWRNARAAWLMHDPDADWHVLIQDDAVPCIDFLLGMHQALKRIPTEAPVVMSPYFGTGRLVSNRWDRLAERADQSSTSWIRTTKVMWGVCLAIPVRHIPAMIAFADRRQGIPDDMRVAGWAARNNADVWYPWPSLIDHATVPSLTKHKAHDRRARKMLTGSALGVDWSVKPVTDPALIRARGQRSGPRSMRRPA